MNRSSVEPVPFNAPGRATAVLRLQMDIAIDRVLSSGWYVLGPEHDALERELAAYLRVDYAVGVANGTDALQLALLALDVGPGDTVLTAANAGGYTSTAARSIGAIPVYADVEASTLLLTVATAQAAFVRLESAPKVLVVTHLFGSIADIEALTRWAHSEGMSVIEDCAQSLGARTPGGAMAGSVGDVSTTSFYPTKNLGALGDGGAVFTSDSAVATAVRELRQYGWESKYHQARANGRNSRLDEMQAAVLRVKLPGLDIANQRRREIHARYEDAIGPGARLVNHSGEGYVGHLAVLECEDRTHVRDTLQYAGIRTDVHYPIADHLQPLAFAPDLSLPVTEAACDRILSIPLFPELTDDEIDRICAAVGRL